MALNNTHKLLAIRAKETCCHHRFPGFHFIFSPNRGCAATRLNPCLKAGAPTGLHVPLAGARKLIAKLRFISLLPPCIFAFHVQEKQLGRAEKADGQAAGAYATGNITGVALNGDQTGSPFRRRFAICHPNRLTRRPTHLATVRMPGKSKQRLLRCVLSPHRRV